MKANRLKVIEALESGKYVQTTKVFYAPISNCYCAWGVMFDTFGCIDSYGRIVNSETKLAGGSIFDMLDQVFPRLGMVREIEEDYDALYSTVTQMNDGGASFEIIAVYLRKLWNLPTEVRSEVVEV